MSWAVDVRLEQGGLALDWQLTTEARWVGVLGASGLGKTSLLEALLGWRGAQPGLGGPVGYLPQDALLMPHWTVAEHFARLAAPPLALDRAEVFEPLGLTELLARPARRLSGGEARRVALARAILVAGSAGTLVLDEPLEALDRLRRVRTLGLLLALKARTDVRVVVVSHRADELALLCDAVQHLTASGDRRSMAPPAKPEVALATEGIHENRLLGEVVDVAGDAATLRVGTTAIIVPSQDLVVGARAVFGLRGDDVLLGLADPGRVSARNKLTGTVRTLRPSGTYVELDVDLGAFDLSTHLTHSAVADLELKAGAPVHLFFKTRAVRLLALLPPGVPDGSV